MRRLFILLLIFIIFMPLVSCKSKQKAELRELETQIEIEASEFDELLRELMTALSTLWADLDSYRDCNYGDVDVHIADANRVVVKDRSSAGQNVIEYYGGSDKYVLESGTSLTEDAGVMSSANPYKEKTTLEEYETPDFTPIVNRIEGNIDSLRVSLNTNLNNFSQEDERITPCYQEYVNQIEIRLSNVDSYLNRIKLWNFDNLDRYIELKQSLK